MSQAAIDLLSDTTKLQTMAKAARKTAQEHFCAPRVIPLYEQFYQRVLSQPVMPAPSLSL
jgi:hypothetical protein